MSEINIATESDISAIQHVASASWRVTYKGIFDKEYIDTCLRDWYSAESLRRTLSNPKMYFLVAVDAGEVTGFCQVGPGQIEGELYRLYVLPSHWRKGTGSQMLVQAEDWLRQQGFNSYGCFVHEQNEVGKRFYARQAFVSDPDRDDGDELFLWKKLK